MGVTTHIVEHLLGAGEGWLGIDDPCRLSYRRQVTSKFPTVSQSLQGVEELQFAGVERLVEMLQKQAAEQPDNTRTGKKKPDRQETQRSPSGESPPPRTTQYKWG